MSHLTPDTPAQEPSLAELTRALDAMREAGFITIAPSAPTAETPGPHIPATGLPEESR